GHRIRWKSRPAPSPYLCSLSHPVCVHGAQSEQREAALQGLQSAYDEWVYVLGMPAPVTDGKLGGGPELDLYLLEEDSVGDAGDSLQVYADAPALGRAAAPVSCHLQQATMSAQSFRLCLA